MGYVPAWTRKVAGNFDMWAVLNTIRSRGLQGVLRPLHGGTPVGCSCRMSVPAQAGRAGSTKLCKSIPLCSPAGFGVHISYDKAVLQIAVAHSSSLLHIPALQLGRLALCLLCPKEAGCPAA